MTTPYPQEIELKLQLAPEQAKAFRAMMARRRARAVEQQLTTRYLDTPGFELSAAGVALRVRREGRRWLQTLKTEGERQGGLSRRAEFEMPVPDGELDWTRFPPEALAWVPRKMRARLEPVFETRFERTAWHLGSAAGAVIEVALDTGEIRAGGACEPICEIELELKSGEPEALFDLALDWAHRFDCLPLDISKAERGVRLARGQCCAPVKSVPAVLDAAMSVEDSFAAICQSCLAQFQANLPGVLDSDDIEYVHQARVALRRLRAALRLYRRVCVLPPELMGGLRALAAALGPARDWDVLCEETLPAIAPHCADTGGWQAGMARLEAHRAGLRAAMRAGIAAAHPGAWLLGCQRWLLTRGWRAAPETQRFVQLSPLADWAARALRRGDRAVLREATRFAELTPPERHALRILIKRQRYALEFFQALYPGRAHARYLARLRTAQDGLGAANDARVAADLLRSPDIELGAMGPFVLGWLAARQAGASTGDNAKHLQNFVKKRVDW
ncbi:MAG: CHAD domain-containing protein [Pseudomonadota bacterium]